MIKKARILLSLYLVILTFSTVQLKALAYDWLPQPDKAALMLVHAHPDDEAIFFGGTIPYYSQVRKLPVVDVCMTKTAWLPQRKDELREATWKLGLKYEPVFGDFPDCGYGNTIDDVWQQWGGKENAVRFLTGQIRKYKPDVLLGHDFNGEYGHPNHMASAAALAEAFNAAGDPQKFPEQLTQYGVWQPKKLYIHMYTQNQVTHQWNIQYPELDGKSPLDIANESLKYHISQPQPLFVDSNSMNWGLYASTVGPDIIKKNDFFENIDTSGYPIATNPVTGATPTPSQQATPLPSVGTGFKAEYFNGIDLLKPALTRIDPQVNFFWFKKAPDPAVNSDGFSVRWQGKVRAVFTEPYTFYTYCDEYHKVYRL